MPTRFAVLASVLSAALGLSAFAHELKLGDLLIEHPWARASIGQVPNGAAYMTIMTEGREVDRLLAVETVVARRAELHSHLMDGGIMRMRPVDAVEIAPGEPAMLQPGGLHVMLMGLKAPLVEGETFALTLVFERAGRVEVEVQIEKATQTEAPAGMKHDHGS